MKGMAFSMAALGAGGLAIVGTDSPDFDRTINRPPSAVYAAFSALGEEGEISEPSGRDGVPAITRRIEKESGESIRYQILFGDKPVVTADLNFEAAGGGGTRMTAELDLDAYAIGSAVESDAGVALAMLPDSAIDHQFAQLMENMVEDVEAGRTLTPLGLGQSGVQWRNDGGTDPNARRYRAQQAQREAVRPMNRAQPMVDPNQAARNYMNGR